MRKIVLIALISTCVLTKSYSQDAHFSQYLLSPQLINPAGFGVLNTYEAGLQYKGQWNSFTNGFKSYAAYANKSFRKKSIIGSTKAYASVGLNVLYDQAGSSPFTHMKADIPVNVTKRVSGSGFFTGGIYLGFGQVATKSDNYSWGSQFDGYEYNSTASSNEATLNQTKSYLDAGLGLNYTVIQRDRDVVDGTTFKNMTGFSISHLNRPNYSLNSNGTDALGMRFSFYEYYHFYLKNYPISIIPSALVQYQAKAYEVVVGGYVRRAFKDSEKPAEGEIAKTTKFLNVGLFYRFSDVCALNAMYEVGKYAITINYDFNVSKLVRSSKSFGGFEIGIKMRNPFIHTYKAPSKTFEKKI
jgi:type IX secretion system PorP/SprF family membrane protein